MLPGVTFTAKTGMSRSTYSSIVLLSLFDQCSSVLFQTFFTPNDEWYPDFLGHIHWFDLSLIR